MIHLMAALLLLLLLGRLLHLQRQRDFLRMLLFARSGERCFVAGWSILFVRRTAAALNIPWEGDPGNGRKVPVKIDLGVWGDFLKNHQVLCFRFCRAQSSGALPVLQAEIRNSVENQEELGRLLTQAVKMPVTVIFQQKKDL